jgi:predicted transcriptional regulator
MDANNNLSETLITLTADIVSAHVSNNSVAVNDLPTLIQNVHSALTGLGTPLPEPEAKLEPAVSVRSSVKPDYIVCLEDGKKLKMLKRHLMTHYQMTPDEYRTKWGLAPITRWLPPTMPSSAAAWPRRSAWAPSAAAQSSRSKHALRFDADVP